jgi:hypothetical protein
MTTPYIVFGRTFTDEPQPMSLNGMQGWWSLPRQWYTRPVPDNQTQIEASPNANFSPSYFCSIGDDRITWVFQDLLRDKLTGILP